MFKKKEKAVAESNPSGKFSRTILKETVETTGGLQTTRTVFTSSSKGDIEPALKALELDTEGFGSTGGTCVTKKIVYTTSGKQVTRETVESFVKPSSTEYVYEELFKHSDNPEKSDFNKGTKKESEASKSGKSLSERFGLKNSRTSTTQPKTVQSAPITVAATNQGKSTPSVKPGKFEDDALKSHNSYRTKHGVPPLKLSKELCAYSKEWADHLAATDTFQHRTERKYGENIFMKWSSDPNHVVEGHEAVDSWYSEIKDHVFGKEPTSLKSGHFTQVIWKKSAELGIAWSRSRTGKIIVVANYNPAGNFVGTFSENVPPPKK